MKDSISMGKDIYELDGNVILIHNLSNGTYKELEFKSPEKAKEHWIKYFGCEVEE